MAYKRTGSRRSYRRSYRRFRGASRRKADSQTRWQWANFKFRNGLGNAEFTPNTSSNLINVLATIDNHFAMSESPGGQGNSLNRAVRYLDIGGIVFTAGIDPVTNNDEAGDLGGTLEAMMQTLLCTGDLDPDGVFQATDYDFGLNTQPIILANSNSILAERRDAPSRIHWRCAENFNYEIDVTGNPGITEVRAVQTPVYRARWQRSIRLRLRLDSTKALVFFNTFRTGPNWPSFEIVRSAVFWQVGSLFYRWVFA